MKAKDVLTKLNITRPTLCSYVKKGYIKAYKLPNGQYDYDISSFNSEPVITNSDKDTGFVTKDDITIGLYKVIANFLKYMNDINLADSKYYEDFVELASKLPDWHN
jgi:hypothetical protein